MFNCNEIRNDPTGPDVDTDNSQDPKEAEFQATTDVNDFKGEVFYETSATATGVFPWTNAHSRPDLVRWCGRLMAARTSDSLGTATSASLA